MKSQRYKNASLEKGLAVLEEIVAMGQGATVALVSSRTGIDYSTTHRLLATLEECGYVERDSRSRKFQPGRALQRLDQSTRSSSALIDIARPVLLRLAKETGETATLSRRDGTVLVMLAIEQGRNFLTIRTHPGDTYPIHCAASGKAILAGMTTAERERLLARLDLDPLTDFTIQNIPALVKELEEVRTCGYSINHEEHVTGVAAIAAPIRDVSDRVIAAICITAPTVRLPEEKNITSFSAQIIEAANEVSKNLIALCTSGDRNNLRLI